MVTDVRRHYRFSPDAAVVLDVCDDCRLACLEPRQALPAEALPGPAICYVLEGTALLVRGERQDYGSAGGLLRVERGESVELRNAGAGRLAVMIVGGSRDGAR